MNKNELVKKYEVVMSSINRVKMDHEKQSDSEFSRVCMDSISEFADDFSYYIEKHNSLEDIIGVEEAARILGLSPGTIKNYCASGKIEAKKIGKTWVIDKNKLNKEG
ncbi:excisionase family DNA binding protein [Virgibacillus natechei]|uniref:Excisionase family DNA binding protein n=1 Tax=Virgibacillus natechei TaxID=1216297 RepID=A0ABS4IJ46_9BACI|nr:helix-turn-helix domain-containing protein [Virgibacillus natechei]MBP1970993.1 excisionase family DNA binding protein [Virgibacillus natechei]UZD12756.1 helix-turn-helix domain-containing protein [Virgibacillus natechei]